MRIYFLYTVDLPFVKRDLSILQAVHEVREENNYRRAFMNLWKNLRGIRWADMVFCWFGSIHFLPAVLLTKLLGKKLVVVAGGYDVVDLRDINYGNMRGGLKAGLVRLIFRLADRVISISESNRRETLENAKVPRSKNIMIYHGFKVASIAAVPKERLVVTVGEVTWSNLKRKGLEDFVKVAGHFPEVPFKLVGKWVDDSHTYLKTIAASNVEIMGFVKEETLADLLSRAKVYVQASRHEGFGCSVAEAMLHGCVPVVNKVFALPEVVGDSGFIASPEDIDDLRSKIESALEADNYAGERARERIVKKFSLEKRAEALLKAIANA